MNVEHRAEHQTIPEALRGAPGWAVALWRAGVPLPRVLARIRYEERCRSQRKKEALATRRRRIKALLDKADVVEARWRQRLSEAHIRELAREEELREEEEAAAEKMV